MVVKVAFDGIALDDGLARLEIQSDKHLAIFICGNMSKHVEISMSRLVYFV